MSELVEVIQTDEQLADAIAYAINTYSIAYEHYTLETMETVNRRWRVYKTGAGNPFDGNEWLGEFDNKEAAKDFCSELNRKAACQAAARHRLAELDRLRAIEAENARLREALKAKPWPPTDDELREMLAQIVGAWWSQSSAHMIRNQRLRIEDIKAMYAVRDALAPFVARAAINGEGGGA